MIFHNIDYKIIRCALGVTLALGLAAPLKAQTAETSRNRPDFLTTLPRIHQVQDWLVSASPFAMPIRPENGSVVQQTPPDFSWPYQGRGHYQFRLTLPDGSNAERLVTANFLHWQQSLPPGRYSWQVRFWPQNGTATDWSTSRGFTVPADAWPFVLGDVDALYDEAARRPHPRTLPTGSDFTRLKTELLTGARRNRFVAFAQSVEPKLGGPMVSDVAESVADYDDIVDRRKAEGRIVAQSGEEVETMLGMAFVGIIREQPDMIADAKRRLLNMAGWSIHGGTGNGS